MSHRRTVWFADAHLDEHAWVDYPDLCGDSLYAFEQIVAYATTNNALAIFGAGDIIDERRPKARVVRELRKALTSLQRGAIPFYFIQGQHEYSLPPWLSSVHNWPKHVSGKTTRLGKYRVYGLDWQPADKLAAALSQVDPAANVLLAHQVWQEFMGDRGNAEGSWEQVITPCLFTGDYHNTIYREDAVGANKKPLRVISPGATNLRAMGEPAQKYFFTHDPQTSQWEKVPLRSRPLAELTILSREQLAALPQLWQQLCEKLGKQADKLPQEFRKPILRISYSAHIPCQDELERVIGKTAFLFTKRLAEERPAAKKARLKRQQIIARGPSGCLGEFLTPKSEPYKQLLRLLLSRDQKADIKQLRQQFLEQK